MPEGGFCPLKDICGWTCRPRARARCGANESEHPRATVLRLRVDALLSHTCRWCAFWTEGAHFSRSSLMTRPRQPAGIGKSSATGCSDRSSRAGTGTAHVVCCHQLRLALAFAVTPQARLANTGNPGHGVLAGGGGALPVQERGQPQRLARRVGGDRLVSGEQRGWLGAYRVQHGQHRSAGVAFLSVLGQAAYQRR